MMRIEAQGHVLAAHALESKPDEPGKVGGKRGKIKNFSRASRRRLLTLTNSLQFTSGSVKFLTLTFSGHPDHRSAKQALRRFYMRLRRRAPYMAAVWRLEYQRRGTVHFHLLIWNMPFWAQKALQRVWTECTGENRSIVDIRAVKSHKHLICYVSKYIAKDDDHTSATSLDVGAYLHDDLLDLPGRFWGVWGKEHLPYARKETIYVNDPELERYLRWAIRAESRGHCNTWGKTITLYSEGAYKMLAYAASHAQRATTELLPEYIGEEHVRFWRERRDLRKAWNIVDMRINWHKLTVVTADKRENAQHLTTGKCDRKIKSCCDIPVNQQLRLF